MTIRSEQEALREALTTLYDKRESSNIADWVIEHITGMKKSDRLVQKKNSLTPEEQIILHEYTTQLLNGRPVQYVLGEAWFDGIKFSVNESVLIPRPETEELVEWISQSTRYDVRGTILDIGTGSGCIPIALKKKLPDSSITSIDISPKAIEVATQNAADQQADINFITIDFLEETNWKTLGSFDMIVSNPPYIRQAERSVMAKHVTDYEPALALFVPDEDALLFYRKIAVFAKQYLNKGGSVFLEINEMLGAETVSLFEDHGFVTELRKDLEGKDRMIKIVRREA